MRGSSQEPNHAGISHCYEQTEANLVRAQKKRAVGKALVSWRITKLFKQNVCSNMDNKGHSDEVSDSNEAHVLVTGRKVIIVTKWQRT